MATLWFLLFWVALGLAIVLVAMRSGRPARAFEQTRHGRRAVYAGTAATMLLFVVAVPILAVAAGEGDRRAPGGVELTAFERHGRELFVRNCAQCHTLEAAAAVGAVGPDLDQMRPPKALILDAIDKGRARGMGQMPADLVNGENAQAVAQFIVKTAGR